MLSPRTLSGPSLASIAAAALLAACSTAKIHEKYEPKKEKDYSRELPPGMKGLRLLDPSQYPDFGAGFAARNGMLDALDASARYLALASSMKFFPYLPPIDHARMEATVRAFKRDLSEASTAADLDRRVRDRYEVYESVGWNNEGEVLFTAYHEPIYKASLTRTGKFQFPIYKRPPELVQDETGEKAFFVAADGTRKPAPPRAELASALKGRGLELAYLADPFEAYVAQVQGSARFELAGGKELRVGYAGDNGHDYHPIWQGLVDAGKLKKSEVSLRRLKEHFAKHPNELEAAVNSNPRFVFFTERTGPAVGCLNVPVTPFHTIATDRNLKNDVFPRAGVAFVKTKMAKTATGSDAEHASFVCDQDRGGAIRSAGRADLFLGTGPEAEALAGRTRAEGRLYYLFLKPALVPPVTAELAAEKSAARPAAAAVKAKR